MEGIDRKQTRGHPLPGPGLPAEPVPGSINLLPFQKGYQDDFGKVITVRARTQAKKDLDAAGWTAGPDGMRAKDGKPLEFDYVYTGDDAPGRPWPARSRR